ncbi:hypothetical protein HDV64DRAFT_257727 [Trichoderma sp. TUCIM 5745]
MHGIHPWRRVPSYSIEEPQWPASGPPGASLAAPPRSKSQAIFINDHSSCEKAILGHSQFRIFRRAAAIRHLPGA